MFNAHLQNADGSIPTGKYRYVWQDNSLWENKKEVGLFYRCKSVISNGLILVENF